MKHLIIIGARGFGREVFYLAQHSKGYGEIFDIKGYLDDKNDALEGYAGYPPIINSVENYTVEEDDVFVCALGDVYCKKKYVSIIIEKSGEFISLIHESAYILPSARIGNGCLIFHNAQISADVEISDFVTIQPSVFLGHDAKIGKWSHLNTGSICNGFVEIGEMATIHTCAVIAPRKKIGHGCTVGACSFVTRSIKDGITVMGNPARKLI